MKDFSQAHLVIIRSYGDILDLKTYNCQEIGLAKALVKKGLKVTFLMPEHDNKNVSLETKFGKIQIAHIKISWKLHARYCWFEKLELRLEQLKPTMIQVHDMDLLMTWRAVRWAKKTGVPCYLIQGPYDKWTKPVFRQINELYNRTFGRYIIKNATRIGVKTSLAAKYLNKYYHCKTEPTIIGLDIDTFAESNSVNWRLKLKIDEKKKVLLYVGSLQPRRNPLFLIDILKKLPEEYVLLFVGGGIQENDVKEKIKWEHLEERCFMLGKLSQKDLPSLYADSDCFLLASDYEILGMVIMEAMYFGIPVISSETTGANFIINNWENGVIIKQKEVSIWVDTIMKLFHDESKIKSIAVAGKTNVENRFLWDKTCETFINLYFPAEDFS